MIDDILKYNQAFVSAHSYEPFRTSKYPDKKIAIVTCMDTRLIELLPAALGLKNGDAKIIKNAGGLITHPFGSVVRSLIIAIYDLQVEEILIIGHSDCGVQHMDANAILEKIKQHGIPQERIAMAEDYGIDLRKWLEGFDDVDIAVNKSVSLLKRHPLIPKDVAIYGYIMDSVTGELKKVC